MDNPEMVEALAECLEALRRGEADLEFCVARYPGYREELKALLDVVRLIQPLPKDVAPSRPFRERTRRRLLGGRSGNGAPGWQYS